MNKDKKRPMGFVKSNGSEEEAEATFSAAHEVDGIAKFSVNSMGGNGELGYTGLDYSGGRIFNEILAKLQGTRGMKIWREMSDNDDTIGSVLYMIDTLIRRLKWKMKPYSQSPEDVIKATFIEESLHDMSDTWGETLSSILSFLPFGFSYHELVYKRRIGPNEKSPAKHSKYTDGFISWRKIPIRDQISITDGDWIFNDQGVVTGVIQKGPPNWTPVTIPMEKALLFRTKNNKESPEGRSLLRNSYRSWWFKQNIENLESIGVERDVAGIPVMQVPAKIMILEASEADKAIYAHLKNIVRNVRNDEQAGIVIPSDYDINGNQLYTFELASSPGKKQFNTGDIIKRYQNSILQTLLADFLKLGQDKVGSFALSENKTELFTMSLETIVQQIEEQFNSRAIPKLFKLNGWDQSQCPMLTHGEFEQDAIEKTVDSIFKLSQAGMSLFPDEALEAEMRRRLNIPAKDNLNAL